MKNKLVLIFMSLCLLMTLYVWFFPVQKESVDERRLLSQFPELSIQSISNGEFMDKFENYAKDQFPNRFKVRQAKAKVRYYGLAIMENNDIYKDGQKAIKIEYPMKDNEIIKAATIFNEIHSDYLSESNNIYVSLIPDKSHYSTVSNIPKIRFEDLEGLLLDNLEFGTYISIKDKLSLDDFYNTDIHWKQESIESVASTLLKGMKQSENQNYIVHEIDVPFNGVYYGHSALPLKSDTIKYITNKSIESSTVTLDDNQDEKHVYDNSGIKSRDQYDFYLHGPQAFVTINNPNAETDNELIIFRDSYASSLTPYFIDQYSKITLIDIRYYPHKKLDAYIDFNDQDILFLYNTSILNSSSMFK